jgi:hypothetical protein
MRREKLYDKCLNKSSLTFSDGLFHTQNEQRIYDSAFFHHIEHNKQVTFVVSTHLTLDCGRQKYFFACVNVRGIGLATLYEEEFKSL